MSQGQANPNIALTPSSKVMVMFPGDYAAADEGSFFTSTLAATASTTVATTTQVLAQANPVIAMQNRNPVGGYNIYLRYIKLAVTVVTTGATSANHVGTIDPMAAKLTTTGTSMGTPVNTNSNSGVLSGLALIAGVSVAAATSPLGRIVHTGQVTGSIPIAFDEWILHFGQPVYGGDMVGTQSLVKRIAVPLPPVIIPPQYWYTLGFWGASWAASAQTYQSEVGWIERPAGQ